MLGTQTARELPYASTLCGACADVCPVKIPIPNILRHLRRRVAEGDAIALPTISPPLRATATLTSHALAQNWIYRLGARLLPIVNPFFRKNNWLSGMPYPLNRWTKVRPLPPFTANFRNWWKNVRSSKETESVR